MSVERLFKLFESNILEGAISEGMKIVRQVRTYEVLNVDLRKKHSSAAVTDGRVKRLTLGALTATVTSLQGSCTSHYPRFC